MLARLQKFITLGLLACVVAWLAFWWPERPVLAAAGAAALLLGHGFFLGLEMVWMQAVNRQDPVPRAGTGQVLRAWWQELWASMQVFCWRQPFFSRAEPDLVPADARGRLGVVLVHGLVCNRGFWTPWLRRLRRQGRPCIAVDLEPVWADIGAYRATLEAAVRRLADATGRPPVLVCHSMGGLVARDWLRACGGEAPAARVTRVFTLGSPHGGTWLARHARSANGRQMQLDSPWLRALALGEDSALRARFSCWYSNCDNVVFPSSTAALPGAAHHLVPGLAHVALAFDPRVVHAVLAEIDRLEDASSPGAEGVEGVPRVNP